MKFTLVRPCANCPFRKDIRPYLTVAGVQNILKTILERDQTFACHKTVDYTGSDGKGRVTDDTQHCAGAMILLEKLSQPNQMMRIAYRLRWYAPRRLDMDSPVYDSPQAMLDAAAREQA